MNAETRAHWHALGVEADSLATKCCYCRHYGHSPSDCPRLAHLNEPGITVERTEQGQEFSKAFDIFLITVGMFSGIAAAMLWEVFWR